MARYLFGRRSALGLIAAVLTGLALQPAWAQEPPYIPKAEQVTDNVYAIIGPLGQRSQANAGLNANYGFIVSDTGVILIDSGASDHSAKLLEQAIAEVTDKPVRWVLNTGAQDHRWLGNGYFTQKGAAIYAMQGTPDTQIRFTEQQMESVKGFVGDQLQGTVPTVADQIQPAPKTALNIDGVGLVWIQTNAHFPADTMIYLPDQSVVFTGDLVYVDRVLSIQPVSDVRAASAAFDALVALEPAYIVPGHGRVTDMAQAQRETGDYYAFLIDNVGEAGREMESLQETLDRFDNPPAFMHLQNFGELHRSNMNRVFVDFEANP